MDTLYCKYYWDPDDDGEEEEKLGKTLDYFFTNFGLRRKLFVQSEFRKKKKCFFK